jgi:hypothetical protein
VTKLAHNDNNGAWYGLFGNMGVQIRLLGAKCGWNLFFPPCSPPETQYLGEQNQRHVFFCIFHFIYFQIVFAGRM